MKFLFVRSGGIEMARYGIEGTVERKLIEPIGIEYCASFLRSKNIEADIYDVALRPGKNHLVAMEILNQNPDCIGFSILYSHMMVDSYDLIVALKKNGYKGHITVGGTYPTLSADFVLKNFPLIDSVSRVEGETTSYSLSRSIKGEIKLEDVDGLSFRRQQLISHNKSLPLITNLDSLPNPSRDNFHAYAAKGGIIQIHSSRGCHANCSFCGTAAFYRKASGPKWRARSPKNILSELKSLVPMAKNNEVWFTDDNFIGPGTKGNERAIMIAEEIIKNSLKINFVIQSRADNLRRETMRKLKDAGMKKVYIGIESGTNRHLSTYQKRLTAKENAAALQLLESERLFVEIGFIGFDPYTTLQEIEENIRFLEQNSENSDFVHPIAFDMLIPYRGTPLAEKLKNEGLVIKERLDFKSLIKNEKVLIAWECIDYLLIKLGPATELVKALIINDETRSQARWTIKTKNRSFILCLRHVLSAISKKENPNISEVKGKIEEVVKGLNKEIGI